MASNGAAKVVCKDEDDDDSPLPADAAGRQLVLLPVTETILGIDETTLVGLSIQERMERFVVLSSDNNNNGCFVNTKTKTLVSFGVFETPTIQQLKDQVEQMLLPGVNKTTTTTTTTTTTSPPRLSTRSGIDIGHLQGTLSTSDCAMVQVASNFNCLENPSRKTNLNSGFLVDKAHLDRTQGPAAVFGTTSAYLYRCHFLNRDRDRGGGEVNLLENVADYFGIPKNGKLTLTGHERLIATRQQIDDEAIVDHICIGLHQDCPIMFGRTSDKSLFYNEQQQQPRDKNAHGRGGDKDDVAAVAELLEFPLVDHVLSASINLKDFGVDTYLCNTTKTNLMRSLLRAAYEGIYLAAIVRRRKVLYLTLVGGGVFGNPIPLIVDEIQRAHDKWSRHPASILQEVVICLFSRKDEQNVLAALATTTSTKTTDNEKKRRARCL